MAHSVNLAGNKLSVKTLDLNQEFSVIESSKCRLIDLIAETLGIVDAGEKEKSKLTFKTTFLQDEQ